MAMPRNIYFHLDVSFYKLTTSINQDDDEVYGQVSFGEIEGIPNAESMSKSYQRFLLHGPNCTQHSTINKKMKKNNNTYMEKNVIS